jgi:tol-pal system protein YbgF
VSLEFHRSTLVLGLFLAGCSPAQLFRQQANVEKTRQDVAVLKNQSEALSRRIEDLEKDLKSQNERLAQNNADMNAQLESLIEQFQRLSDQLDDVLVQLQRRPRGGLPQPPPGDVTSEESAESSSVGTGSAEPNPEGSLSPEELYDQAYRDVTRGGYGLALAGFGEFLRLFSDHPLADNAQYWMGECHYVQDHVPEAAEEFRKVLDRYPEGDKVPAAYLKLGYCALRSNDPDEARRCFDEIVKRFPATEEARSARTKLATLN